MSQRLPVVIRHTLCPVLSAVPPVACAAAGAVVPETLRVLLSVLAAVEVASHFRLPRPRVLYTALGASLAIAWAVPAESLLALTPLPRFLAATVIAFMPIFFANLIFSQRFKSTAATAAAFAANLLGAMVGGILEYMSLLTGYRALLVVVAGLYTLSLITRPKAASAALRRGARQAA